MLIRRADIGDCTFCARISEESFLHPWTEPQMEEAVASSRAVFLVAADEEPAGEILGYCIMFHAGGEGEIESIAVSPEHRKKGIGKEILETLIQEAVGNGIDRIFLEVREKNDAAGALYRSMGFIETGRRKDFYKEYGEDAVLMRLDIG